MPVLLRDGRLLGLALRKDSVCLLAIDEAHCSVAVKVFFWCCETDRKLRSLAKKTG